MRKITEAVVGILARHWRAVAVFAAVMTLAIAMLQSIGRGVWFDEGYSIMLAQRPVQDIVSLTAVDAHPPLYYLFLKAWASLFGWSELSLRLNSAVIGAASVGVLLVIIRRLFSPKTAVVAAPFLVLAPFVARYNYEIRMYALVGLIGLLATLVLLLAQRSRSGKWWLAYALLVAAGMYTLYMSVVFWLAHVAWLLYQNRVQRTSVIRQKYWLYYGLAALLFVPWVPTVLYQLQNSALPPYMTAITLTELVNILGILLSYNAEWQIGPWLSLGLLVALLLFAVTFARVWRAASARYRRGLLLLGMGFLVSLAFYAAISLPPNPARFMERYIVHTALFFYAVIGVTVALGWRAGYRRAAGALGIWCMVLLLFGQATLYSAGNYNFQRLQPAQSKVIRQAVGCDQTTFVTSGAYGYIDLWYDFQGCELKYFYPWQLTLTGGFAPLNATNDLIVGTDTISSKRVVFVYYDDSTDFLTPDARYRQVGTQDFDRVHIQIYER